MLVHGAVVPPRAALEAVAAVMRSVSEPGQVEEPPAPKGLLGRIGRHRGDPNEPTVAAVPMLEHVPAERMQLPITGFGNLTTHDADRIGDAIAEAAVRWEPATVRFAGGTALDFPGDWSVWAKLEGDVDALMTIARAVTEAVEALGFFVDRRQFRPMLSVATVTTATTGPFLESVVEALESSRGDEWTVDIALTKETFVGGRPESTELRRIQVGT